MVSVQVSQMRQPLCGGHVSSTPTLAQPSPHQQADMQKNNFDLIIRSAIVRSEKPGKGLTGVPAPNPNQMNRVIGYIHSGEKVVIAQRPGKGGMDFNKVMSGKIFAIAADGLSPVYEKVDGKPTKNIKREEGLPLYSSSGFYLMSSKEYPALEMMEAYTKLRDGGNQVLIVTDEQMKATVRMTLESELDLEMLCGLVADQLSDERNLVSKFDAEINKKRARAVQRAKEECEDRAEEYTGVEFEGRVASKKDGNPFIVLSIAKSDGIVYSFEILREEEIENPDYDDGRKTVKYFTPEEAVERLRASMLFNRLTQLVESQGLVTVWVTQGNVLRTSVSFRRKVENHLAAEGNKKLYGDSVYIDGALKSWCKGLISVLHSMHPNFPASDYDSHHYVAAVRQAELGMDKAGDKWQPPQVVSYVFGALQKNAAP